MSFKNYLIEQHSHKLLERHDIVLQQIIDMIDSGHIDYAEDKVDFDIGTLIGQPKLKGLGVAIRKSADKSKKVRLGQREDGGYAIVIDTDEIPVRQDIDALLSSKDVYGQFGSAFNRYMKTYFDKTKEYDSTKNEVLAQTNNRDAFEGYYSELLKGIGEYRTEYDSAVGEIDKELGTVAHSGRKLSLELAKQKLRDEYIGATDKDFISKVMKLPNAKFGDNLNKDWKAKLEARLGSYYGANFAEQKKPSE